jgi:hypothetical protein
MKGGWTCTLEVESKYYEMHWEEKPKLLPNSHRIDFKYLRELML